MRFTDKMDRRHILKYDGLYGQSTTRILVQNDNINMLVRETHIEVADEQNNESSKFDAGDSAK